MGPQSWFWGLLSSGGCAGPHNMATCIPSPVCCLLELLPSPLAVTFVEINTFFWLFGLSDARCPSAFPRCSLRPVTRTDLLQPVETPPAPGTSLGASCHVKGEGRGLVLTAAPIKKQLKAQPRLLQKARQSPAAACRPCRPLLLPEGRGWRAEGQGAQPHTWPAIH